MANAPLAQLEQAAQTVYRYFQATPQYAWPLLSRRAGTKVWVKHENHTPVGAFKVRGGLNYLNYLVKNQPEIKGILGATRGNHGQSIAYAANQFGLSCTVVVPEGNSVDKNEAMKALGAELVEYGHDFQASLEYAKDLASERQLHLVPSYHHDLAYGVATYSLEFLQAVPDMDTLYVPIGLGSGICGAIIARDALNIKTKIVGVVSKNVPTYALSFEAGKSVSVDSADTMADGLACRVANEEALAMILKGVERVVTVSEDEIFNAINIYYTDTHNVAEGAGAAPLAALLQEKSQLKNKTTGVVLSGGNIDKDLFLKALSIESKPLMFS